MDQPVAQARDLAATEPGEHLPFDLVDRAVAAIERPPAGRRQLVADDAPVVRVGAASTYLRSARSASTSLIDCGVTSERRASWAFESPSCARRTDSAV